MTIRINDNAEEERVEVQERSSLENHPHLSSVKRKSTLRNLTNKTVYKQYFIVISTIFKDICLSCTCFYKKRSITILKNIILQTHTCTI